MRFLVDQDIYKTTIDNLREWGHDVLTAKELGFQQASDQDLLKRAQAEKRLLLTRDKGFGGLVFLNRELSTGVILLRMTPWVAEEVHHELHRLLEEHGEEELRNVFCVVELHRHRIRHLP
jgi:predicted nuclease of predicted toxin-antitoxin system